MTWVKKHKKLLAICILTYGVFIALFSIRVSGKEIILKGGLTLTSDIITIGDSTQDNRFYTIYILSMDQPTLFQYFIACLDKKIDIQNIHKGYLGYTMQDYYKMGQIDEVLSFQNAIITAYEKASEISDVKIDYDLEGYVITYLDKKQSNIQLGDVVLSVNNKEAKSTPKSEFFAEFSDHDFVTLVINRNGKIKEIKVETLKTSGKYGFNLSEKYNFTTTPTVENKSGKDLIGGPSGGLIQTLSIYTELLNISLNSLKVSGTGTINSLGIVGPIGGIKQKIYTAASEGIDIFFVPNENYAEALIAYNNLKKPSFDLIKVGDFDEAVEKLDFYLQNR